MLMVKQMSCVLQLLLPNQDLRSAWLCWEGGGRHTRVNTKLGLNPVVLLTTSVILGKLIISLLSVLICKIEKIILLAMSPIPWVNFRCIIHIGRGQHKYSVDTGYYYVSLPMGTLHWVGASFCEDCQPRTRNVPPKQGSLKLCNCESKHFKAILYSGNGCGKGVDFVRISSDSHEHRYILK